MRTTSLALLVVIVGLTAVAPLNGQDRSQAAAKNIVELAVGTDALSTLVAAVKAAGLVETLAGDGPFTVFAPTNEAFAKLPDGAVERLLRPENREALVRLLTFHVVPGSYTAGSALARGELGTVAGPGLAVSLTEGRLRVGGAAVVANDIQASNGVVHVIDTVLIPPRAEPPSPVAARLALFTMAIDRGVPLFNDGNQAACALAYEVAVQAVLDLSSDLEDNVRSNLVQALDQSRGYSDATERAWALRRGMDYALNVWVNAMEAENTSRGAPSSARGSRQASTEGKPLFEFNDISSDGVWFTVNDDVMGGISKARFEATGRGSARFAGALSLDNNGGFATIRSPGRDLQIDGYDGLVMRVRGDGRTYGFSTLPSDRRFEINTWRTNFKTTGDWQEIRVPFDALVHQVMGRRNPATGALPPEKIRSVAFSVSDKNETPFSLEIDWIRAYRNGDRDAL